MAELIGSLLVLLGAILHFSAGLGMLRMPDVFTRMQAGTKASTLGNTLVLAGLAFYHPGWSLKLLILIYFVLMTNPVSSHALARAAYCASNSDGGRETATTRSRDAATAASWQRLMRRACHRRRGGVVRADLRGHCGRLRRAAVTASAGGELCRLVPQELGAPNVITGILLTFRAFDTLGEVAVLFMVAAGVGLVLGGEGRDEDDPGQNAETADAASEIVQQRRRKFCVPLISIFARLYHHERPHLGRRRLPGRRGDRVRRPAAAAGQPRRTSSTLICSGSPNRWQAFCSSWSALPGWSSPAAFSTTGCCRSASSAPSSAPARSRAVGLARRQGRLRAQRHHRPLPD